MVTRTRLSDLLESGGGRVTSQTSAWQRDELIVSGDDLCVVYSPRDMTLHTHGYLYLCVFINEYTTMTIYV